MKKLRYILELLIVTSILISCNSQEETKHLGIDAEIVKIDSEGEVLTVKDISDSGIFGEASDYKIWRFDCGWWYYSRNKWFRVSQTKG